MILSNGIDYVEGFYTSGSGQFSQATNTRKKYRIDLTADVYSGISNRTGVVSILGTVNGTVTAVFTKNIPLTTANIRYPTTLTTVVELGLLDAVGISGRISQSGAETVFLENINYLVTEL